MKPARLRSAGFVLLFGVALGGAATGGYALGAASPKPRVPAAGAPQAARAEDVAAVLRQIEQRLARLEATAVVASQSQTDRTAPAEHAVAPAEAAGADPNTPPPAIATSDPDVLLTSQRVVEAGLAARNFTEAQKTVLRETLPRLAFEDRLAVMNQLGVALNRGEIEFDARDVF
jgi:hypothetical protein